MAEYVSKSTLYAWRLNNKRDILSGVKMDAKENDNEFD